MTKSSDPEVFGDDGIFGWRVETSGYSLSEVSRTSAEITMKARITITRKASGSRSHSSMSINLHSIPSCSTLILRQSDGTE